MIIADLSTIFLINGTVVSVPKSMKPLRARTCHNSEIGLPKLAYIYICISSILIIDLIRIQLDQWS